MQLPLKCRTVVVALSITVVPLGERAWSEGNCQSEDVTAVMDLVNADNELNNAFWQTESKEERKQLVVQRAVKQKQVYFDLIELAEKHPQTTGGLAALYWASFISPETVATRPASQLFQEQAATVNLEQLAAAIVLGRYGGSEDGGNLEIAHFLLNRVKENSRHDKAAEILTSVCRLSMGNERNPKPTPAFVEAADLIESQHATSPVIWNFCEILEGSPRWAGPFERHLRTILQVNQDRAVRCAAAMALPSVIQLSGSRQVEAAQLYQKFLDEFDGKHKYHYQFIEKDYRNAASKEINRLKTCAIGEPAPEINGIDLEGKPMNLSDYRGKVVLLSYWAMWCAHCVEIIPHEKAIAKRFEAEPFAILGVNGDSDLQIAQAGVTQHGISWRSFRDEQAEELKISEAWSVRGWPTLYVIDREGIIRKRCLSYESFEEIGDTIAHLIEGESTATGAGNGQAR